MNVKIITIRFDQSLQEFNDMSVQDFINSKYILSVREYFFMFENIPFIVFVICYDETYDYSSALQLKKTRYRDEYWKNILAESDLPLFNALREWRNTRSKKEGVPPYIICTNKQLAAIVKSNAQTLNALMNIDGFGKAKAEKYGNEILSIISAAAEKFSKEMLKQSDKNDNEKDI